MNAIVKLTRNEFNSLSDVKKFLESGQVKESSKLLELVNPLAFGSLLAVLNSNVPLKEMIVNFEVFEENVEVAR